MLKITARINIGDNGGELNSVSSSQSGVNNSSTLDEVKGHHTQIQKPFILGRSRLGGGDCYTKKANYYIGSVASDSNGNFPTEYKIYAFGVNITQLTIVFNKRKNEFPKSIKVDGKDFYDDDTQWTIPLAVDDFHTIVINNWNTPNSPLVISSIYADLSIDIDDTNLIDFNCSLMSRDNVKQPSFGIISNSGNISFIDKDGEIADYIAQQIVNSQNVISVYLENTKSDVNEKIGYFNTQQWSYTNSQSLVDVTLKDDLEEWQSIKLDSINYVPTVDIPQTAKWLYEQLYEKTPNKFNMLPFYLLDTQTQTILSGTTIQYPVLDGDTLWGGWDKLCQLCFLNIYKDNKGRTVCIYSGG